MAVYISYIDEMGSPVYNRNDLDGEVHTLTCGIYGIYWSYKLGKKLGEKAGDTSGNKGILFLILSVLGLNIVALCIAQSEVNSYIE